MRRSKIEVYVHLVWATYERTPYITQDIERTLYRCIAQEATRCKCKVLALNGMPDHTHLVVALPATIALSRLMQMVKGTSSALARDHLAHDGCFGWQDSYAAKSVCASHLEAAIAYVQNQKRHHSSGQLWDDWESTNEIV